MPRSVVSRDDLVEAPARVCTDERAVEYDLESEGLEQVFLVVGDDIRELACDRQVLQSAVGPIDEHVVAYL